MAAMWLRIRAEHARRQARGQADPKVRRSAGLTRRVDSIASSDELATDAPSRPAFSRIRRTRRGAAVRRASSRLRLSGGYASVVLDVDSTLCGLEGIDWLAARRGREAGVRIAELTDRAMNGELALDAVYGERLGVVRPTREDLDALAIAYEQTLAPGAASAIARMRAAGRRIVLVSGGIRNAILPVARRLGIDDTDVHAVSVLVGDAGEYEAYDAHSPMTTADGKRSVVAALGLPRRLVAVGDGATDLAIRPVADAFVAFTGYVRREPVVAGADAVVESFDQLVELVLA
jgi:phosphoserine phosphatase